MIKKLLYWVLFLPISTALLLEGVLQLGSAINPAASLFTTTATWQNKAIRIVAMGDSNTYGLYLDRKDSYPKQLETLWNSTHPDKKIEVINLGYPGANSSRLVANIEQAIQHFEPDIILIMIGTNDSWTAPITRAETNISSNATSWILSHSRTYRLFCLLTRPAFDESEITTITTSDPAQRESAQGKPAVIEHKDMRLNFSMELRNHLDQNFNADEITTTNLTSLIKLSRYHKRRLIFLTYPANKNYYKQANKLTRITMNQEKYADFIDVSSAFTNFQPSKNEANDYFFLDLHATAKGNHLVAETIATHLETLLAIEEKK